MTDLLTETWEGEWWSPADPTRRVEGTLTFQSQGEFSLDLKKPLVEVPIPDHGLSLAGFSEVDEQPVVLGRAKQHDITLLDCTALVSVLPTAVVNAENWIVNTALIGVHLTGNDDAVFTHARMKARALPAFADGHPVGHTLTIEEGTGRLAEFTITGKHAVVDTATMPWGTVSIVETPTFRSNAGEYTGGLTTWFEAGLTEPHTWQDAFHERIIPLRNLLAVLYGKAVPIETLQLRLAAAEGPARSHVRLLLRMPEPSREPRRAPAYYDFLFTRTSLPGGFQTALSRWVEAHNTHKTGVGAVTDALFAAGHYIQDDLVDYVRAVGHLLERQDKDRAKQILAEHEQKFLDDVQTRIPPEDELHREVMRRLTEKPWRPSERDLIEALIDRLGAVGTTLVGADAAGFARRIVETRNYLAHSSSKPNKWVLGHDLIVPYTAALKWVLRCTLLLRLGASTEEIAAVIENRTEPFLEKIATTTRPT